MTGALRKRSVVLAGHRTSLSLEPAFWDALKAIAAARRTSINALIAEIDRERTRSGESSVQANLSSAVRVFVLRQHQARAAAGTP